MQSSILLSDGQGNRVRVRSPSRPAPRRDRDRLILSRGTVMRCTRFAAFLACILVAGLSAQSPKKFVRPAPGQTPPYSLGITAGGVIYVAGQLPTDDKGNLVTGDITVQA